jgi:parallel beta-helix repeat protein
MRQGASVVGATRSSIEGGKFYGTDGTSYGPMDGIDIEPNANIDGRHNSSSVSTFLIRAVTASGNLGSGIEVNGESGRVSDVSVVDSDVSSNAQQGIVYRNTRDGRVHHNTISLNAKNGISVYHSIKVEVTNNVCSGNKQGAGIIIQNPSGQPTGQVDIEDNVAKGNYIGIEINGLSSTIEDVTVSRNTSSLNMRDGILVSKGVNIRLENNQILTNSQLEDNVSDNIAVHQSRNSLISSNVLRHGNGPKQPRYGISVDANSVDTRIQNNDLVSSGRTDAINTGGVRTNMSGNKLSDISLPKP